MIARHFLDVSHFSSKELIGLLELAIQLREHRSDPKQRQQLLGKSLALVFQKPSLRTRVSFEQAIIELGGHAISLQPQEIGLGQRESIEDVSRVLSRFVDIIMIRAFDHQHVLDFADSATIPVINGLTDSLHPCQALADALTIFDVFGTFENIKVAYVGDGNNVCNSLVQICQTLGMETVVAAPTGFEPSVPCTVVTDPKIAVSDADVVYTDTWLSMGEEDQQEKLEAFGGFCVDAALMSCASPKAVFMHCLPAHRGQEVTNEVFENPQSKVFDQAENRLHAQKAVLVSLLQE